MTPNSTEERIALVACPFCGGEASPDGHIQYNRPLADTEWADGSPITEAFFVNCVSCGITNGRPGLVGGYQTQAEAVERWNRRTDNDVSGLETRLRMIVSHASGGALHERESLDWSINDICVEISRHKNDIWEQAQKSALAKHRLSKAQVPFAFCCAEGGGRVIGCNCVNKNHGTAWVHAAAASDFMQHRQSNGGAA